MFGQGICVMRKNYIYAFNFLVFLYVVTIIGLINGVINDFMLWGVIVIGLTLLVVTLILFIKSNSDYFNNF
jgi:hypothetical protein